MTQRRNGATHNEECHRHYPQSSTSLAFPKIRKL
jgi:hypothetical protein